MPLRSRKEFVIAHAGKKRNHTAGGSAVLDRVAGGFSIDGTNRVGADAHAEHSVERRAHIQSIEQVKGAPGFRAGNMNLACRILHDAGIERQKVADITGGYVGDVHNLRRIHGDFVGDLFDIDAGNRVCYVYLLRDDLFVIEDDADAVEAWVKIAGDGLVEAGLIAKRLR